MHITSDHVTQLRQAIQTDRLLNTAISLIEIPSPTRSAAAVADKLASILTEEGFAVERPEAGWSDAPAVVSRYDTGRNGRTLQYNGHLDTVHLSFVPPRVEQGVLYGSGCSDMKGGIAAAVEAMRVLRDSELLSAGAVLFTAHDLHESPWGDGTQVNTLIDEGYVGDGVLLPEYLCEFLPVVGRGLAILEVEISRSGDPIHEVLGGIDQPSVIQAGANLIGRFGAWDEQLRNKTHALAGRESMFVGQVAAGEIYNQSPTELRLAGTRRWLSGTDIEFVRRQYRDLLTDVADAYGVEVDGRFHLVRDAFELDRRHPLISAFQAAHKAATGAELPHGAKPFVDDGNEFVRRGSVPAITHGPDAKGAHTLKEEVPVDELVRVALVYALAAVGFCHTE